MTAADYRVIHRGGSARLFLADGSRLYDIDAGLASALEGEGGAALLGGLGLLLPAPAIPQDLPPPPPLAALSLMVAQACNMGCGYCYAQEGRFGGRARLMPMQVATAAVDRLIAESRPGADLVLGFMGGEPLLNRAVVHGATRHAAAAAARAGRRMRFSITTNATLIRADDALLFADHPFTVQVSLDGAAAAHDRQRPMKRGGGTHDAVLAGLDLMAVAGRPRHLSARISLTPASAPLMETIDHCLALGFDSAGAAAVTASPDPKLAFAAGGFAALTAQFIACGERALAAALAGSDWPFANFATAMHEIHAGSHRPHACGAGAAYLAASAEGRLFACHRLIDDDRFAMGDLATGSDRAARAAHLAATHVDRQEPCRSCWARYLCGGGCQQEVAAIGRPMCDHVRAWLGWCLGAAAELSAAQPQWFNRGSGG